MTEIIFTRYLFEKINVKIALLFSLLDKNEDDALFWASELYYSGYEVELEEYLWITYFQFYSSLNFYLEQYFIKKKKEYNGDHRFIVCMVSNLLIKPYTLDVFLLYNEYDDERNKSVNNNLGIKELVDMYSKKEYTEMINVLKSRFEESLKSNKISMKYFADVNKKEIPTSHDIIILSRIFMCLSLESKKKLGKKIYMSIDDTDLMKYSEFEKNDKPRFVLREVKYNINRNKYSCLFNVKYDVEIEDAYYNKWEYYANKCPLWNKRFQKYSIIIDDKNKKLTFNDDDESELFYDTFNYEPDEQPRNVIESKIILYPNDDDLENIQDKYTEFINDYNTHGFITDYHIN